MRSRLSEICQNTDSTAAAEEDRTVGRLANEDSPGFHRKSDSVFLHDFEDA